MQIVQPAFLFGILLLLNCMPFRPLTSAASGIVYTDRVNRNNIKTVQLHVKDWEMSYPVIELGGNDQLLFSFDDTDGDVKNYQYTIIHCNADWTRSSLLPSDYLDGFHDSPLGNYRLSFNTFLNYTHYYLTIPSDGPRITVPGNFILKIYDGFDQDNVVLTRRFMITQTSLHINATVHRPRNTRYYDTGQQVSIDIMHPGINIIDPYNELFVTVVQNGRQDNIAEGIKPLYIRSNQVIYEHDEELVFPGGNEFRSFDTRNLRYKSESVRSIDFAGGMYHIELHPSGSRGGARYFSHNDINGRFLVRNEAGRDPAVDADYVAVYFTLPVNVPPERGRVYVIGALSDWKFDDLNMMTYNHTTNAYEISMLLKQGYYNFQYLFLEDDSPAGDTSMFEGDFFETENEYLIAVYHRPPGSRYDRLVGVRRINSRQQTF